MPNPNFKENKLKRAIAKSLQPLIRVFSKRLYVSLQYRYITGKKLNWKTLRKYTEKLQFLRLYVFPKDPLVIKAASRAGARAFLIEKGFEDILIPSYGIYDCFEDIDFDKLPNQFVLKATHASGFNYICFDKEKMDINLVKKTFSRYLATDYGKKTVEPHYSKIKPKIIVEAYIGQGDILPIEYKIHCFNGVPRYLYVVTGRGKNIRYNNYYVDWTPFNEAQFNHWKTSEEALLPPSNYKEMLEIAKTLSKDFPFVRLDFYSVDGKIYFSEFTFTPAKGTLIFDNEKADYEIGSWLDISKYH